MASTSSQPPSSSPSISTTSTSWDVFLSFRGTDTRYNFTSHLYSALDRHNIRTYMDDRELRCGEVVWDALLQAIQESKTYIVVFSENYASSSWCLDELVEIISCSKTMNRLVIPVFYNIDPSVVRHQTASFEEHFKRHEDRLVGEMERVKNWRLTLRQVAHKSGKHVDGKRPEADIVTEIVDEILLQIKSTVLPVAEHSVGLNSRVDDITALLSGSTIGVIKIGIYGMSGVGKTTLARAVFNHQLSLGSFKRSCFLENVREISRKKGLESLQQKLINDVLKSKNKVEVCTVDEGTKLIESRICSTKILVVIDDLDDHKKFKSLMGPFASGSVVIITTWDEETLDSIDVKTKYRYRVNELGDTESETLFFRHALGDTTPNNTQMILSKDILRLAGGLPLALEVFGSSLYKKSEGRWKSYIETLQRIPNNNIQQRFMVCLNSLESDDPLLKKMFLDIACFFIGREKEEVVEILDTYYSHTDDKIDILKKRSLLKINDDNEFRMHDLLQDVGKEIARNNSRDEPGKYSRLWQAKDICSVLKEHKGTEAIEGIMLPRFEVSDSSEEVSDPFEEVSDSFEEVSDSSEEVSDPVKEVSFAMETFTRMSKLRFLSFDNMVNLTGNFERTLEDLRWFCWSGCPLKCLPFDFRPQKIVILELPRSKMTTIWEVNKVPNAFKNLKTLNMSFSQALTTTPDFRRLPCLRKLNFEGCESLKEVHNSIGSLESLVSLNLNYCINLRSLPGTICNLRALEVLCIQRCIMLEALPIQLGNIKSLKGLDAVCLALSKLPDSIGDLSKLVMLDLGGNKELKCLPDTICNLRALEVLRISNCTKVKELPEELGKIESLKELDAESLALSKLPDSIGDLSKLVNLELGDNQELECLPHTIGNLRALEVLRISNCTKVKELPEELGKIESLIVLVAEDLDVLKLPDSICNMRSLKSLHILGCNLLSITKLPPNLKYIRANNCTSLERLNLSNLKHLKVLCLYDCRSLTEILGLGDLKSLELMDLRGCPSSLLALTLTEPLFQIYSGFEKEIGVMLESEKFPDWIIQSSVESVQTFFSCDLFYLGFQVPNVESSSSLNLQPNLSHNYLGMILCFEPWEGEVGDEWDYPVHFSVMTSASNILTDEKLHGLSRIVTTLKKSSIVIVPRSIFTVTDADHTINFTSNACRHWIHLLYKNEDDSTTVNVEDERNNLEASDLEVEGGYSSKRLKLLECDKTSSLEMVEP